MTFIHTTRATTFVIAAAVAGFGAHAVASADTFNYVGPSKSDTSWSDDSNWSQSGFPGAGDTASIGTDVYFNSYNGQAVGIFNNAGKLASFRGSGTFTFDNDGSLAELNSAILGVNADTTLAFTDDLTIDANEITLQGTIQGPGTLTISTGSGKPFKSYQGSSFAVDRVDLSGVGQMFGYGGGLTSMAGAEVYLGSTTQFEEHSGNYSGLNDSSLEMDSSYTLFSGDTGENITLNGWEVDSVVLPNGTYDVNSDNYNGVDFGTIFDGTTVSFTVVPEPASLALLGLGSLLIAGRRRRALQ